MAYTIEQLFTRACSLVDSLKTDGTVDSSTTSDYRARTLTLVDMAQKELIRLNDTYSIYELSRYPVENLYGYATGFDIKEYDGTTPLTIETNGSVKTYYFESDSNGGTAYIEDYTGGWNTVATIPLTNTGLAFKSYKGSVIPSANATKSRIRFTGSYYYKIVNYALFKYPFESGKEPVFRPWIPIELPIDLKSIFKVILEYPNKNYAPSSSYKIEWSGTRQTLYVDYFFKGKIRVQYKPVPTVPTSFNDTISLDDTTATAMCYYLAMNFVATEQNDQLTALFRSLYEQAKSEVSIKQPVGETSMIDVYGSI